MRIIAVMSPKGGIGKTTTSDSIAYMIGEEQGKRVLVLDGDPQGDTSKTFGVFEPVTYKARIPQGHRSPSPRTYHRKPCICFRSPLLSARLFPDSVPLPHVSSPAAPPRSAPAL